MNINIQDQHHPGHNWQQRSDYNESSQGGNYVPSPNASSNNGQEAVYDVANSHEFRSNGVGVLSQQYLGPQGSYMNIRPPTGVPGVLDVARAHGVESFGIPNSGHPTGVARQARGFESFGIPNTDHPTGVARQAHGFESFGIPNTGHPTGLPQAHGPADGIYSNPVNVAELFPNNVLPQHLGYLPHQQQPGALGNQSSWYHGQQNIQSTRFLEQLRLEELRQAQERARHAEYCRKSRAKQKQHKKDIEAKLEREREQREELQHKRELEKFKEERKQNVLEAISKSNPALAGALIRYDAEDVIGGGKLADHNLVLDSNGVDKIPDFPALVLGQDRMNVMAKDDASMYYRCEDQRRSHDRKDRQQNQGCRLKDVIDSNISNDGSAVAEETIITSNQGRCLEDAIDSDISSDGSTVVEETIIISTGRTFQEERADLSRDNGTKDTNKFQDIRASKDAFPLNNFSEEDEDEDDGVSHWNIQEVIKKANKEMAKKEAAFKSNSPEWKKARQQAKLYREQAEQKEIREEKFFANVLQEDQLEMRQQAEAEREQAAVEREQAEAKARDLEAGMSQIKEQITVLEALYNEREKALQKIRRQQQPPPPNSP